MLWKQISGVSSDEVFLAPRPNHNGNVCQLLPTIVYFEEIARGLGSHYRRDTSVRNIRSWALANNVSDAGFVLNIHNKSHLSRLGSLFVLFVLWFYLLSSIFLI